MEEKLVLNEADVVNPSDIAAADLSARFDLLASPTDTGWNDLYKEYKNSKAPEYSVIWISGIHKKNVSASDDFPEKGYLKYDASSTGTGTAHKFLFFGKKQFDTVEAGKIELVDEKDDASIFKPEDAKIFIDAIKRNKDLNLRGATLYQEKISTSASTSAHPLTIILNNYFNLLATGHREDNGPANFIRNGSDVIIQVCNGRNSPLVGNPLLDVLANAFMNAAIRNSYIVDNRSVTTLTNLIAKSVVSVSDLKKLGKFKAVLVFNNSLYKLSPDKISDLFNIYDQAQTLSGDKIGIADLKHLKGLPLAKHLLLSENTEPKDTDTFEKTVLGMKITEDDKPITDDLGHTPEDNGGALLKNYIRTYDQAKLLFDRIAEGKEEGKDSKNYYLQVVSDSTLKVEQCTVLSETDESIDLSISSVELKEKDIIRLVRTEDSTKENIKATDILKSNTSIFKEDSMSDKFNVDKGVISLLKTLKTGIQFTIGGDSLLTLVDVRLVSPEESEATPSDEETEEEVEATPETPSEATPETPSEPEETKIDKTGLTEVEPVGRLDGEVLRDVHVEPGDVVIGLDGNELKVTPETVGDGTWDIKAGTKMYIKPVDLNHLSNGKSLADILISRDVFRSAYPTLTQREKTKLRGVVNPSWLPSA